MKKLSVSLLAFAAVLAVAPAAHADQTPGWYVGAGVGGSMTNDSTVRNAPTHSQVYYNPGWDVNANTGYAWTNGLRLEAELFHSRANVDAVHNAPSSNGHLSNTDLFANAFYDFKTGSRITPYVGAGVGGAWVDVDHIGTLTNGSNINGDSLELAYQAIGGVAAQLDPNWSVSADYRYIATTDPKLHTSAGPGAYIDNSSHNIMLGLRYSFNTPAAAPVAAAPAPRPVVHAEAPKPAVAPVAQSYMVFFDFNKSDITPEAKQILASAAQDYKQGGIVRIVVTGHTDTVGTIAYNQKLSERRAASVKAELSKLGVDAAVVKAVGVGKNGLLVPTADGVREAQNRRAEIVFDKK